MNNINFADVSFPVPSKAVFDKMLFTDWYDGITGGLLVRSRISRAFKLDILAWDLNKLRRTFVLSVFDIERFDLVVGMLSRSATPTWPRWDLEWPSETPKNEGLRTELERQLKGSNPPEYVLNSDASFETVYGLRRLEESVRDLLPQEFDGLPFRDNFGYWEKYMKG